MFLQKETLPGSIEKMEKGAEETYTFLGAKVKNGMASKTGVLVLDINRSSQ
ncbi:hypothetical protein D3C87_2033050 [compost metagenome]